MISTQTTIIDNIVIPIFINYFKESDTIIKLITVS